MCDMCSSPEAVYRIELEGSRLNVCEQCAAYGKIIARLKQEEPEKPRAKKSAKQAMTQDSGAPPSPPAKTTETVQLITSGYPGLIKKAREKKGFKQEQLGKRIAEKISVIHKLESGSLKPDISLARKLEKELGIKLVEEVELDTTGTTSSSSGQSEGLTLGDLIKKK